MKGYSINTHKQGFIDFHLGLGKVCVESCHLITRVYM